MDTSRPTIWEQLVAQKNEWIGGDLQEIDSILGEASVTKIIDIRMEPHGDNRMAFIIDGKDYSAECFDVRNLGVVAGQGSGWLTLSTPFGSDFRIRKPMI